MQKVVQSLPFASRGLAICAVLAGLAPGLITFSFAGFVCFDNCPTRGVYFAGLGAATVQAWRAIVSC